MVYALLVLCFCAYWGVSTYNRLAAKPFADIHVWDHLAVAIRTAGLRAILALVIPFVIFFVIFWVVTGFKETEEPRKDNHPTNKSSTTSG